MKKKVSITIPTPCLEDSKKMAIIDKGRFCSSCNKHIIDFTRLSDIEIVRIINEAKEKVCGRFLPSQLNRPLKNVPKKASIFPQLLLGSALSLGFTDKTEMPSLTPILEQHDKSEPDLKNEMLQNSASCQEKNYITGVVKDKDTGEPLPGVSIFIEGTNQSAITDIDGKFKLNIPDNLKGKKIKVQVSFLGFETKQITINTSKLPLKKDIKLELSGAVLGETAMLID